MNELDYYCYLRTLEANPIEGPVLRGAMISFRDQMRLLRCEPVWIAIVISQLLLCLALFAPLIDPLLQPLLQLGMFVAEDACVQLAMAAVPATSVPSRRRRRPRGVTATTSAAARS